MKCMTTSSTVALSRPIHLQHHNFTGFTNRAPTTTPVVAIRRAMWWRALAELEAAARC